MQARGPSSPQPCVHWARGVGEHFVIFAPCQRDCTRPLLQGDKSLHLFVVCLSSKNRSHESSDGSTIGFVS